MTIETPGPDAYVDPALAVTARLTEAQRVAIVDGFTRLNPHWRGADAADILDALDDSDAYLESIEPYLERHPELAGNRESGLALLAILCTGRQLDNEAAIRQLLPPGAEFGMSMVGAMNYLEDCGIPRGEVVRVVNQASRSSSPVTVGGHSVAFKSSPGRGLRCHITAETIS